jgi:hypothetical protein
LDLISWADQKRVVPITTSQTESRIRGYVAAGDIELTKDEIEAIDHEGKRKDLGVLLTKSALLRGSMFAFMSLVLILLFKHISETL